MQALHFWTCSVWFLHLEESALMHVVCPDPHFCLVDLRGENTSRKITLVLMTFAPEQWMSSSSHYPVRYPLKLVEFIAEVGSWLLPVPDLTTVMATLLLSYRLQALSPWRVISFLEERYLWLKTVLKTWEYWSWFWEMLAVNHLIYLNIGFIPSFLKDGLPAQKMNNREGENLTSFW